MRVKVFDINVYPTCEKETLVNGLQKKRKLIKNSSKNKE